MSRYTKFKKSEDDYMSCYFHPEKSKENFSIEDTPIMCTSIIPPQNKFNKNKLGFVYSTKYRWLPETNPYGDGTVKFGYKPIYIKFVGKALDLDDGWGDLYRNFNNDIKHIKYRKNCYSLNGKQVPYTTLSDGTEVILDPLETRNFKNPKEAIEVIVKERWQPLIDIPLIFLKKGEVGDAQIRIDFDVKKKRTYSMIGTSYVLAKKDECTMNFAWYDVGSVLHEFGHALGLVHEHQSPENNPLVWNKEKLYEYYDATTEEKKKYINDNIINRDSTSVDTNGTSFDEDSIMLYYFPSSVTTNGTSTHANQRLSITDMIQIHKLYPVYDKDYKPIIDLEYIYKKYDDFYGDANTDLDKIPDRFKDMVLKCLENY